MKQCVRIWRETGLSVRDGRTRTVRAIGYRVAGRVLDDVAHVCFIFRVVPCIASSFCLSLTAAPRNAADDARGRRSVRRCRHGGTLG